MRNALTGKDVMQVRVGRLPLQRSRLQNRCSANNASPLSQGSKSLSRARSPQPNWFAIHAYLVHGRNRYIRRKSVRFAMISTLAAAATLATASIASAQNDQRVSDRPRATTNAPAATKNAAAKDAATNDAKSLTTLEQETAIPYRACIDARGWVNGRLRCSDD
jgi:hypothetical protein